VDVLGAFGPAAREAARKATSTIPIVTVSGSDPIREGWAQSFAHPGGNVTGLTVVFPELVPKCLEFLKEAFPAVVRVGVLIDPTEVVDAKEVVQEIDDGARRLGLQLQSSRSRDRTTSTRRSPSRGNATPKRSFRLQPWLTARASQRSP
jgi:putative ABC transport system substrate-binding protein